MSNPASNARRIAAKQLGMLENHLDDTIHPEITAFESAHQLQMEVPAGLHHSDNTANLSPEKSGAGEWLTLREFEIW